MYVDAEEVKSSKRKPRPESLSSSARLKKGYATGGIDVLSDAVGQGGASHKTGFSLLDAAIPVNRGRNEKTGETVFKSAYHADTADIGRKLGSKNPSSPGGAAFPHTVDDAGASPFAAPRLSTVQREAGRKKILYINNLGNLDVSPEPPALRAFSV